MTDDYTTPEIARALKRIEQKVDQLPGAYVPRGEFEAWRAGIGRELAAIKSDVRDVEIALADHKREIASARPGWHQVMPAVVAVIMCAITVVTIVAGGGGL